MTDPSETTDHLYERDGALWAPTSWAGSPWTPSAQHGGAVNALMMCAAEEAAAEVAMRVARLTVDLFKPVPLEPLVLETKFLRRGRLLSVVEASLARPRRGDVICSARSVLLTPRAELPPWWEAPWTPPPGPGEGARGSLMPREYADRSPPGFHHSVEICSVPHPDEKMLWVTTPLALTAEGQMSPLQRLAALSDLTFGIWTRLATPGMRSEADAPRPIPINTDTTLHVIREPEGPWLLFRDASLSERDGIGCAGATIADASGQVARSAATLVANG